jgi:DNA polymerase elongation subunit (family B)
MNLFFDIETVEDSTVSSEKRWLASQRLGDKYDFTPEYHKIFCISIGYELNGERNIKTLSWDEKQMIEEFYGICKGHMLIGFNIKWFDIPFIIKRWLKYGIPVPYELKQYGKKPWEVSNIIDLYEVYKMNWFNSASLDSICTLTGITTSKDGIDGSQVAEYVASGKGDEVIKYCEEDVRATIDIYNLFKSLNVI